MQIRKKRTQGKQKRHEKPMHYRSTHTDTHNVIVEMQINGDRQSNNTSDIMCKSEASNMLIIQNQILFKLGHYAKCK